MSKKRLECIDLLRGFAIIIMIIANASPYLLHPSYSFVYRTICSLAAPVFLFLSGFSFALTYIPDQNDRDKLMQAGYLLCSAALLDAFVWHICPFHTFDVLYCIAAGLFLNWFLIRLKPIWSLLSIGGMIIIAFVLQGYVGYRSEIVEMPVHMFFSSENRWPGLIHFRRMFIDGWFPLFPWLVLPVAGSLIFRSQALFMKFRRRIMWVSGCLAMGGIIPFFFIKADQPLRKDYVELFYPADAAYLVFAFFAVLFLFSGLFNDRSYNHVILRPIKLLGKNSLFVYLFHAVIIAFIFQPLFSRGSHAEFALLMLLFLLILLSGVTVLDLMKRKNLLNIIPVPVKRILGIR